MIRRRTPTAARFVSLYFALLSFCSLRRRLGTENLRLVSRALRRSPLTSTAAGEKYAKRKSRKAVRFSSQFYANIKCTSHAVKWIEFQLRSYFSSCCRCQSTSSVQNSFIPKRLRLSAIFGARINRTAMWYLKIFLENLDLRVVQRKNAINPQILQNRLSSQG